MKTPLMQYVARFDGGGENFGFGGGGYKESWPWCSLFSIEIVDYRAGWRGYVQFNKYTHTHTHTHTSPLGRINANGIE